MAYLGEEYGASKSVYLQRVPEMDNCDTPKLFGRTLVNTVPGNLPAVVISNMHILTASCAVEVAPWEPIGKNKHKHAVTIVWTPIWACRFTCICIYIYVSLEIYNIPPYIDQRLPRRNLPKNIIGFDCTSKTSDLGLKISWKVSIQICCTSWIFRFATTSSTAAYWNLASFPAVLEIHNSEISGWNMLNGAASSAPWQTVAVDVCVLVFFWGGWKPHA